MLYILTYTEYDRGHGEITCHSLAFESIYLLTGFMLELEKYKSIRKIEIEILGYECSDYNRKEYQNIIKGEHENSNRA